MIRAVFFDFYSVWTPDVFSEYLALAQNYGPKVAGEIEEIIVKYFQGEVTPEYVADTFRYKLSRPDIDTSQFTLAEADISPEIVTFMRGLHGHFVKLGVLANLGPQEYALLTSFNNHNQLFEVITGPLYVQSPVPLLSQEMFEQALQAIGEPTRSCLVVSGNTPYLSFAESLGIATLPFEGFPKLKVSLDQLLTNEVT